jgi:hypothetical protein
MRLVYLEEVVDDYEGRGYFGDLTCILEGFLDNSGFRTLREFLQDPMYIYRSLFELDRVSHRVDGLGRQLGFMGLRHGSDWKLRGFPDPNVLKLRLSILRERVDKLVTIINFVAACKFNGLFKQITRPQDGDEDDEDEEDDGDDDEFFEADVSKYMRDVHRFAEQYRESRRERFLRLAQPTGGDLDSLLDNLAREDFHQGDDLPCLQCMRKAQKRRYDDFEVIIEKEKPGLSMTDAEWEELYAAYSDREESEDDIEWEEAIFGDEEDTPDEPGESSAEDLVEPLPKRRKMTFGDEEEDV